MKILSRDEGSVGMNGLPIDSRLYIYLSGNEALNPHVHLITSYETLSPIKSDKLHQLCSEFPDRNVLKSLAHNIPKQLIYKKKGFGTRLRIPPPTSALRKIKHFIKYEPFSRALSE